MRTSTKRFPLVEMSCTGLVLLALAILPVKLFADEVKADFVGSDTCLTCHADHSSFSSNPHAKGFVKLKGIAADKSCETCHGPGSLHAAAAGDRTNPGFATINNMKGDVSATCFQCHKDQRRVHWAASTHASRNVTCTSCHSVHNAKSSKTLLSAVDEKALCFQCHKDIKAEVHRNSHMPIIEGKMTCGDCHNPHGSATNKMLASDNVNQLCFKCHAEKRGPFLHTHPPVQENCMLCHSPHGSHNDKMLNAKLPMLCQRCHAISGHNNVAYDSSDAQFQRNRVANKGCVNCHSNIHGSNHPSGQYFQR